MGATSSKLTKEEQEDLLRTTHYNKKELHYWYKSFYEACPNGRMDSDKLHYLWKQTHPLTPKVFSMYLFDAIDRNQIGWISFKDFITFLSITTRGTADERLRWNFRLYDIDHDGRISRKDLFAYFSSVYKLNGPNATYRKDEDTPEKFVDKFFLLADKDKTGLINWTQFREAYVIDPDIFDLFPKDK